MKRTRGRAMRAAALAAAVLCLFGAWPAAAAESLQQAWTMALGRDPGVAAVAAEAESAAAQVGAARAARGPSVEASADYTRYDVAPALDVTTSAFTFRSPRIFDDDDSVMAGARISLPLYTGGSLSAGVVAATQTGRAAEAAARQAEADLKLDVAARYVAVLRARLALAAAEASVAALAAHVADVTVMVERETVATNDLLAARVALANAQQQRLRAANGIELANASYNRRLGQPLGRVPDLEERIPVAPFDTGQRSFEELVQAALTARDELAALDARAAAFDAQARAESGRLLPQVALAASYSHLETTILDREDFATVGIGFRWTLFDGGQARQRAASLRRLGAAARYRREDLRTLLELQVRESWLGVGEADARRAAVREAVAQADENLRITRELYGAGLATNTQVLEAVSLRIGAANNSDDAQFDADLARLRLARSIGAL